MSPMNKVFNLVPNFNTLANRKDTKNDNKLKDLECQVLEFAKNVLLTCSKNL